MLDTILNFMASERGRNIIGSIAGTLTAIAMLQQIWKGGGKKLTMRVLRALPDVLGSALIVLLVLVVVVGVLAIPLGIGLIGGIAGAGISLLFGVSDPQTYGNIGCVTALAIASGIAGFMIAVSLFSKDEDEAAAA